MCSEEAADAIPNIVCTPVKYVVYILNQFGALSAQSMSEGVVGSDSFEYMVADELGYNSTEAKVTISVMTPLETFAVTAPGATKVRCCSVLMYPYCLTK